MTDSITIHPGTLPWEPADFHTQTVAEYHRYDIPLIGAIEQSGVYYLFRCLAGAGEHVSVWAYTILSDAEKRNLDDVDDEGLDDLIEEYTDRPGVAAAAVEGFGIVACVDVNDWSKDSDEASTELFASLNRWIEGLRESGAAAQRVIAMA